MKKTVRLTESDISRIVNETLEEISWRPMRDAYNKHERSTIVLSRLSSGIEHMLDNFEADGDFEGFDNDIKQPILQKVYSFKYMLEKYKEYFDKKLAQIDKFEKAGKERFTDEFGKSPKELEDDVMDKENALYDRYRDDDGYYDQFHIDRADLEHSPEYQAVQRYNNY